jgi:hypothetical protein
MSKQVETNSRDQHNNLLFQGQKQDDDYHHVKEGAELCARGKRILPGDNDDQGNERGGHGQSQPPALAKDET